MNKNSCQGYSWDQYIANSQGASIDWLAKVVAIVTGSLSLHWDQLLLETGKDITKLVPCIWKASTAVVELVLINNPAFVNLCYML